MTKYYVSLSEGVMRAHLDGAFSAQVKRFFRKEKHFAIKENNGFDKEDVYDILTDKGGLHIRLRHSHGEGSNFMTATVKSSIVDVSTELILEFVKLRLETEIFLSYDNYKDYHVKVYDKK